jgi:peptide/nickel transport system ATP-binding protein
VPEPLLEIEDLVRYFTVSPPWLARLLEGRPRRVLRAVDGVSLAIGRGETFALVGESGCGKSTVARLIVGLHVPTRGVIRFEGTDLTRLRERELRPFRRRMQIIFQDPYASLNPRWRVRDIVGEPLRHFGLTADRGATRTRVAALLTQVGLAEADGEKYPHEFSGGQRQRVSIARALGSEPDFLACDEPTSALDVSVQAQILNLMRDLQRRLGLTYLFISHNLAVVRYVSDRVGIMYLGRLVEVSSTRAVFERPRHPYTRLLLDSIPDLEMTGRLRHPVAGEIPDPIDPPSGCAFHPRCPFAEARCRREIPALRPVDGGRAACHAVEEGRLPFPGDRLGDGPRATDRG